MRMGYVLLLASAVPGVMAWVLALKGLSKASVAADTAEQVAKEAADAVARSQTLTAATTGPEAVELARANAEVAQRSTAITDAVSDVRDSLKELTGVFAPTRAFLAVAVLLVASALVALDVINVSLS